MSVLVELPCPACWGSGLDELVPGDCSLCDGSGVRYYDWGARSEFFVPTPTEEYHVCE